MVMGCPSHWYKEPVYCSTPSFPRCYQLKIMPYQGSCLCGEIKIELNATPDHQYVCHCTDCRQTSGSALATNFLAPKSKITITGPVKEYTSQAASGNMVTRIFCGNCGSAVAHTTTMVPDLKAIQTGNLPHFANVPITDELYVKDRWTGLGPISGANQVDEMPGLDFIQRASAVV